MTERRNDIDGLRGVAVGAIVLFHLNKSWIPGHYFVCLLEVERSEINFFFFFFLLH